MIHFVEGEALRDYLRCPQEYAYRYIYKVPEPPRTPQQHWDRAVRRTALSIVRELMEGKTLTPDKTALLWQLTTQKTVVAADAKLEVLGRQAILAFWNWLEGFKVQGLAVTRRVNFEVNTRRSIDVDFTADFVGTRGGRKLFVLLVPPSAGLLHQLAALDSEQWVIYNLGRSQANEMTKLPMNMKRDAAGAVEQGWRGIGHRIVWPNKDARCDPCPYRDICTPGDSRGYLLKTTSKHKRVLERIAKQRAFGG